MLLVHPIWGIGRRVVAVAVAVAPFASRAAVIISRHVVDWFSIHPLLLFSHAPPWEPLVRDRSRGRGRGWSRGRGCEVSGTFGSRG